MLNKCFSQSFIEKYDGFPNDNKELVKTLSNFQVIDTNFSQNLKVKDLFSDQVGDDYELEIKCKFTKLAATNEIMNFHCSWNLGGYSTLLGFSIDSDSIISVFNCANQIKIKAKDLVILTIRKYKNNLSYFVNKTYICSAILNDRIFFAPDKVESDLEVDNSIIDIEYFKAYRLKNITTFNDNIKPNIYFYDTDINQKGKINTKYDFFYVSGFVSYFDDVKFFINNKQFYLKEKGHFVELFYIGYGETSFKVKAIDKNNNISERTIYVYRDTQQDRKIHY